MCFYVCFLSLPHSTIYTLPLSNASSISLCCFSCQFVSTRRVSIAGNNPASQQIFPHWCDLPQHFPFALLLFSSFCPLSFCPRFSLHVWPRFISFLCLARILIFYFPASDFLFVNLCVIKARQINFLFYLLSVCVCGNMCVYECACIFQLVYSFMTFISIPFQQISILPRKTNQ